jgi:hypothetical protein
VIRNNRTRVAFIVFSIAALIGCRNRRHDAAPSGSASAVIVTSAAPSNSMVVGGTVPSTVPVNATSTATRQTQSPKDSSQDGPESVSPALQRARYLQSKGKGDEVYEAFVKALVVGGKVDLRALAELGFYNLMQGYTEGSLDWTFLAVVGAGGELGAQAWYNLSLLYAKRKDSEAERAALARSLRLREHPSVERKLGTRSRCIAEISKRVVPELAPKVVNGWVNVCKSLQRCRENKTYTDEMAKNEICVTQGASVSEPPEVHGCTGEGPWESVLGYMMYTFERAWISVASPGKYFVGWTHEGAWPAVCRGTVVTTWSEDGDYVIADSTTNYSSEFYGYPIPQSDPEKGRCLEPIATSVKSVWNRKTGALLAAVETPEGEAVTITVHADEKRLTLSGSDCEGYVPLDGSMRWVESTR